MRGFVLSFLAVTPACFLASWAYGFFDWQLWASVSAALWATVIGYAAALMGE